MLPGPRTMSPEQAFRRRLTGARCIDLQCLDHYHEGKLAGPCCAIFLRTQSGSWVRFFFQAGEFFWSDVSRPDAENDDGEDSYRLRRPPKALLLGDGSIESVVFEGEAGEERREVTLEFSSGVIFYVLNQGAETTLSISAAG